MLEWQHRALLTTRAFTPTGHDPWRGRMWKKTKKKDNPSMARESTVKSNFAEEEPFPRDMAPERVADVGVATPSTVDDPSIHSHWTRPVAGKDVEKNKEKGQPEHGT
mmetsp:Transcript_37367/g.71948  ORF Transcript_37367/g.71948 Transcript_37367/m.71948 type:complete len:107 (-) Transcript_37367:94-414(-)